MCSVYVTSSAIGTCFPAPWSVQPDVRRGVVYACRSARCVRPTMVPVPGTRCDRLSNTRCHVREVSWPRSKRPVYDDERALWYVSEMLETGNRGLADMRPRIPISRSSW